MLHAMEYGMIEITQIEGLQHELREQTGVGDTLADIKRKK